MKKSTPVIINYLNLRDSDNTSDCHHHHHHQAALCIYCWIQAPLFSILSALNPISSHSLFISSAHLVRGLPRLLVSTQATIQFFWEHFVNHQYSDIGYVGSCFSFLHPSHGIVDKNLLLWLKNFSQHHQIFCKVYCNRISRMRF